MYTNNKIYKFIKLPSTIKFQKIGLFGGSFNPAHNGHLHLSLEAIKILNLDEIWWIITPQNPLKSFKNTLSLKKRIKQIQKIINHPKIKYTYLEFYLKNNYTNETINYLISRKLNAKFVWLMGADNLKDISNWKSWKSIFNKIPIAIFNRYNYGLKYIASKAAIYFKKYQIFTSNNYKILLFKKPPVWCFIYIKQLNISSSNIRSKQ